MLASSAMALSIAACTSVVASPQEARVDDLAAAERLFAANAGTAGVKVAFLDVLDDDATLFRPGPVAGRADVEARPEPHFHLAWQPQRVAVAASGELGYSSGPSKVTLDARPDDPRYGQYFSIWRRAPDGRWRLLIDHGIGHADSIGWASPLEAIDGDGSTSTRSIAAAELDFARTAMADGEATAYRTHGSKRLRVLRDDVAPIDGLERLSTLPDADGRWTWTMTDSGTSRAADLAWTMGRYRATDADSGYFVRVWHVEQGDWKVVGDVLAPIDQAAR